ncbi:MAG: hypothetical protein OEW15_17310 [Nitrospirota bacterium]|nr:hypothetical protein [Nitrospirota bacterium]
MSSLSKERKVSNAKKKEKPVKKPKHSVVSAESAPQKKTEVKITAAKGRPMLTWVGKRPLSHVTAFPAQHIETFSPHSELWANWPSAYPKGGLLPDGYDQMTEKEARAFERTCELFGEFLKRKHGNGN